MSKSTSESDLDEVSALDEIPDRYEPPTERERVERAHAEHAAMEEQRQLAEPRRRTEPTVRFYIGVWLPVAGALLTYSVLRGSFWAAFVGIELLAIGWYTLAKL